MSTDELVAPMKAELVSPDTLVPYQRNARKHSEYQVEQIARSIKEFGFINPILCDEFNVVIAGHARLAAAVKLGLERVPVVRVSNLDETQRRAYTLADNKLALGSEWDYELLKAELQDLNLEEYPLELTGFTEAEFAALVDKPVENPTAEWQGMPEFTSEDQMAFRTLKVHFASQKDVDAFAELVEQYIGERTKYIWFPPAEIDRVADTRYAAEE